MGSDRSVAAGGALARSGVYNAQLNHGSDDYAYDTSEFGAGMDLFADTEETDIDFVLMGGSMASETDTKAKATKVIGLAAARKDAIAFVSPHKGNQIVATGNVALSSTQQKENTLAFFSGMTSTSYAVLDSGYKYMYDRWNDKYRYIPCNGDVAGLCVSTSASLDDWYSPAGLNRGGILNAVKLAYNPNKADRDELYQNRINPITSLRGQGITLFGDKTASHLLLHSIVSTFVASSSTLRREHADWQKAFSLSRTMQPQSRIQCSTQRLPLRGSGT